MAEAAQLRDVKYIDWELFKALRKFGGDKNSYRSCRVQAWKFIEDTKHLQDTLIITVQ